MSQVYYEPLTYIGANGGQFFNFDQSRNGRVLRRIGVWAGPSELRGIRVWMSGLDGATTFGTARGSYSEYSFADGERITRLSLWGNGIGTRTGAIRFETTTGRTFHPRMTSWSLRTEYPAEVASGLCVGFFVRANLDIDALAFLMLRTITFSRLINVSYPTLGFENAGIVPVTLDSFSDQNNQATNSRDWTFAGSRTVTISSAWSLTSGIEAHASVSVQAGIPVVAEVNAEFGWTVSVSGTYETSHEESRTLTWSASGTLAPGQWISIQATTRRGTIALPYQGTMQVTLQNGTVFEYPLSGVYAGVDFTSVDITSVGTRSASEEAEDEPVDPQPQPLKEPAQERARLSTE